MDLSVLVSPANSRRWVNITPAGCRQSNMQPPMTADSTLSSTGCAPKLAWGIALIILASPAGFLAYGIAKEKKPPTWEYKVENISDSSLSDRLNLLGAQGWNLIQARHTEDTPAVQAGYEVILKRITLAK